MRQPSSSKQSEEPAAYRGTETLGENAFERCTIEKKQKPRWTETHEFLGLYRSEGFHYSEGLWTKLPKMAYHLGETLSRKKKLKAMKMNPVFSPLHAEQGKTGTSAGFILT